MGIRKKESYHIYIAAFSNKIYFYKGLGKSLPCVKNKQVQRLVRLMMTSLSVGSIYSDQKSLERNDSSLKWS